jgi:dTMP kinase
VNEGGGPGDPVGGRRGLFLVVEGVEGAGKSTQVAMLSRWLKTRGISHIATREPGGTALGEALRALVLDRTDLSVPPEAELLVILAARATFVQEVVRPALERGELVLSDRYELSTFAYQGWGRGLDLEVVRHLSRFATGGLAPDLYLLLDLSVQEGAQRQRQQGKGADRFEGAGEAFLSRVRQGYLALAALEPNIQRVDALGTSDAVHEQMKAVLQARFPETFGPLDG